MSGPISADLICLFKCEPCLWDSQLKDVSNEAKDAAILRISEELSATEPGNTPEVVCKKIKYLKKVYGEEKRKLKQAVESGTHYRPKLWYFELLGFLDDQPIHNSPDAKESNAEENDFTERVDEGNDCGNIPGNEAVPGVLLEESDSSSRNSFAYTPTIHQVFSLKQPTSGENSKILDYHLPNTKSVHTVNQAFPRTIADSRLPETKSVHTANQAFPGTIRDNHQPDTKCVHTANQAFPGTIRDNHLPDTKSVYTASQAFPGVIPAVELLHGVYNPPKIPTDEEQNYRSKRPRMYEDRCDVFGKGIAIRMRGLPRDQMLLAERMINETLFQAETGCLTLNHRLIDLGLPPQPQPYSQSSQHHSHPQLMRWYQYQSNTISRQAAP